MTASPRAIARDVTVVVPTTGGPFLEGCLDSIAAGTVLPARLVVVDQSGGDAAPAWVASLRERGLDVLHLQAAPAGISAATNRGLEQAQHQPLRPSRTTIAASEPTGSSGWPAASPMSGMPS